MKIGKNKKILIVEDDLSLLKACEEKFYSEGFVIFSAKNGVEAVDKALKYLPDVILLDLLIPTISGAIVIDRIKEEHTTSHIPIFIFSAMPKELIEAEYPKEIQKAVGYIEKDKVKISNMVKIIVNYLNR